MLFRSGSQAILLLLDAPPPDLLRSTEIDLYPSLNPEKSDLIDGAIGAFSTYVRVLFKHQLVKLDTLIERIALLDAARHDLPYITQWTQRRAQEAFP